MHGLIRPVQLKRREAVGETSRTCVTCDLVPGARWFALSTKHTKHTKCRGWKGKASLCSLCSCLQHFDDWRSSAHLRPLEVWSSQLVVTPLTKSIGVLDGDSSFGTKFERTRHLACELFVPSFPMISLRCVRQQMQCLRRTGGLYPVPNHF